MVYPEILRRIRRRSLKTKRRGRAVSTEPFSALFSNGKASIPLRANVCMRSCCSLKAWHSQCRILRPRFYRPESHVEPRDLDLLTSTGEWVWIGAQSLRRKDGLIRFYPTVWSDSTTHQPPIFLPVSFTRILFRHLLSGSKFLTCVQWLRASPRRSNRGTLGPCLGGHRYKRYAFTSKISW